MTPHDVIQYALIAALILTVGWKTVWAKVKSLLPLVFIAVLAGTACASTASDTGIRNGGVQLPPDSDSFGDVAMSVSADGTVSTEAPPDRVFAGFLGDQLPASDKSDWNMILYCDTKRDPESRMLKRDLDRHESLRILKDWCKYLEVDLGADPESQSAQARAYAAKLDGAELPTLLVLSHPDHPVFGEKGTSGWEYAFERAGYGGDAALLARDLFTGLQRTYQRHGVKGFGQCPGPDCPWDPDDRPRDPWLPPDNRPDIRPSPDRDNGWDTKPLPTLPDMPGGGGVMDWVDKYFWHGVTVLGIAYLIYRAYKRNRADAAAILLAFMLATTPTMAADTVEGLKTDDGKTSEVGDIPPLKEPSVASEEEETPDAAQQAYLKPPIPPGWGWLDDVIRDNVALALQDPRTEVRCEGLLMDSFIEIRNDVAGVVERADDATRWVKRMFTVFVLCQVVQFVGLWYVYRRVNFVMPVKKSVTTGKRTAR
jgi:hypothetical protein